MRRVDEQNVWTSLKRSRRAAPSKIVKLGGLEIDVSAPCTIIAGKNGVGKSRLLRDIEMELGHGSLRLDMHFLCEQALMLLRSRDDFDQMTEEFDPMGPDDDRRNDVQRVVARRYDSIEWFSFEIEPPDDTVAQRFRWSRDGSDDPLIPFFRVTHHARTYTSAEMGLGEFSVHFLFWILEQYRDVQGLTLLLDEPDAYLPPIGVEYLLARVQNVCLRRGWQMIMATHSAEIITQALDQDALTVLRLDERGSTVALRSVDVPHAADRLLPRPPVEGVLFCEDESARYLTRALLEAADSRRARSISVVWGGGHGYLRKLHEFIPRVNQAEQKFAYVFDGDQRGTEITRENSWPAMFLPTDVDPDSLFQNVASNPVRLASRINADATALVLLLDSLGGADPHDWVNAIGENYGRQIALTALAALWVEDNLASANAFLDTLNVSWN